MELPEFDFDLFQGKQANRILVVGVSGSGKSTFIKNAYKHNKKLYSGLFVFTAQMNDGFYNTFDKPERTVIHDDDQVVVPTLELLLENQLSTGILDIAKDGTYKFKHRFCVICDDLINQKIVKSDDWSKIWGTFRKANIDIFFTSHIPSLMISVPMKASASFMVIFNMGGAQSAVSYAVGQIEDKLPLFENESAKDHRERARRIYHHYCVDRKYGAIIIDMLNSQMYYY